MRLHDELVPHVEAYPHVERVLEGPRAASLDDHVPAFERCA
ncbi:hypothetical protein ACL02T_33175 [Pseudonocardia sp. RS010]